MHWHPPTWLCAATVARCDYLIEFVLIAVISKAGKLLKLKKKRNNPHGP
jgi:hypothetical protein